VRLTLSAGSRVRLVCVLGLTEGDILMDLIITTQSQAPCDSEMDSTISMPTSVDPPSTSFQQLMQQRQQRRRQHQLLLQQQEGQCGGGAHVSVRQTVRRILTRLGLSQLTPLVDRTVVSSQPDTASNIQVTAITVKLRIEAPGFC